MPSGKKGCSHWNERRESLFREELGKELSFGERHIVLCFYEQLKCDGRTKEGKLVRKRAQMRLATASDSALTDLAKCEVRLFKAELYSTEEILNRLIKKRGMLGPEEDKGRQPGET